MKEGALRISVMTGQNKRKGMTDFSRNKTFTKNMCMFDISYQNNYIQCVLFIA